MVMGQEERKNKAKLEKTQIQLATTSNEYEAAVKALEETTGRWNRDWKAACDVCNGYIPKLPGYADRRVEIPRSRRGEAGLHQEQLMDIRQHRLNSLCQR